MFRTVATLALVALLALVTIRIVAGVAGGILGLLIGVAWLFFKLLIVVVRKGRVRVRDGKRHLVCHHPGRHRLVWRRRACVVAVSLARA